MLAVLKKKYLKSCIQVYSWSILELLLMLVLGLLRYKFFIFMNKVKSEDILSKKLRQGFVFLQSNDGILIIILINL